MPPVRHNMIPGQGAYPGHTWAILAAWWSAQRQQSGDQSMRRIDLFALEAEDK